MICRKMVEYKGKRNLIFMGIKGVEYDENNNIVYYAYNLNNGEFELYDETKEDDYKKDKNGKVVKYPKGVYDIKDNKNSYATGKDAICQSVMQRLSLIQGELFHFMNLGLPSYKVVNKSIVDSYVIKTCLEVKEVINIKDFNSVVENNNYKCSIVLNTNYGEVEIK